MVYPNREVSMLYAPLIHGEFMLRGIECTWMCAKRHCPLNMRCVICALDYISSVVKNLFYILFYITSVFWQASVSWLLYWHDSKDRLSKKISYWMKSFLLIFLSAAALLSNNYHLCWQRSLSAAWFTWQQQAHLLTNEAVLWGLFTEPTVSLGMLQLIWFSLWCS